MNEKDIQKEVMKTIENQTYEKVNSMYLTKYQKEVLDHHHIPYQDCQDVKELLFYLSDILDDEEYDDLENVAREIAEYDYYR